MIHAYRFAGRFYSSTWKSKKTSAMDRQVFQKVSSMAGKGWSGMGILPMFQRAIQAAGWKEPTRIQEASFASILRGRNVLLSDHTGSGKTAAYLLPLAQRLTHAHRRRSSVSGDGGALPPSALVLLPTRDLVSQTSEVARKFSEWIDVEVWGEESRPAAGEPETAILRQKPRIVLTTLGRASSLLGSNSSHAFQAVVLDECDRMLGMGFLADVRDVFAELPRLARHRKATADRLQAVLVSATVPDEMASLVERFCPAHVRINLNADLRPSSQIEHRMFLVHSRAKLALLRYLLKRSGHLSLRDKAVLVFVRTRQRAERLAEALLQTGHKAAALHRGLTAAQRDSVRNDFIAGNVKILVATDVLARGVDFPDLPYVVNFDLPSTANAYVHRTGRTGRAGSQGVALSFVGREPQLVTLNGQLVEINEMHYLRSLHNDLGSRLLRECKIPGRWSESLGEEELEATNGYASVQDAERAAARARELRDARAGPLSSRLRRPAHKSSSSSSDDPPLRNFAQGRYEAVIASRSARSLRNRGMHVNKVSTTQQ